MLVVVAAQPVVLIAGRWMRNRRAIAITTLAAMALGAAGLPLAGHWPGPLLQAAGFGLFVVTSTAWVKENVSPERLGGRWAATASAHPSVGPSEHQPGCWPPPASG